MKLRIKGDSLRLRISPSEMSQLLTSGCIEETIHFGPQPEAGLTYALLTRTAPVTPGAPLEVQYRPSEVTVVIGAEHARIWAEGTQVGVYARVSLPEGSLELAVEKDFACLDKNASENQDAFPNPNQGAAC
jgi:hypothetical protein